MSINGGKEVLGFRLRLIKGITLEELDKIKNDVLIPGWTYGEYVDALRLPGENLPPAFRALAAAPVVQFCAYYLSVRRGLEPGQMRYSGWLIK